MNEILGEIGDSSKDLRNENPQNQEANFRSKINEEYNEDDLEKASQELALIVL